MQCNIEPVEGSKHHVSFNSACDELFLLVITILYMKVVSDISKLIHVFSFQLTLLLKLEDKLNRHLSCDLLPSEYLCWVHTFIHSFSPHTLTLSQSPAFMWWVKFERWCWSECRERKREREGEMKNHRQPLSSWIALVFTRMCAVWMQWCGQNYMNNTKSWPKAECMETDQDFEGSDPSRPVQVPHDTKPNKGLGTFPFATMSFSDCLFLLFRWERAGALWGACSAGIHQWGKWSSSSSSSPARWPEHDKSSNRTTTSPICLTSLSLHFRAINHDLHPFLKRPF